MKCFFNKEAFGFFVFKQLHNYLFSDGEKNLLFFLLHKGFFSYRMIGFFKIFFSSFSCFKLRSRFFLLDREEDWFF